MDNVVPIRATLGMDKLEQLRRFVAFERARFPSKTHIAEWALHEIERLQAALAVTGCDDRNPF